jgi:molybdopterin-binding protein
MVNFPPYRRGAYTPVDVIQVDNPGEAPMKISARNTLAGTVRKIELGAVNAEVTLELAPDLTVVSIITNDAVSGLKLKVGDRAYAVIKASSVMIGVD